MSFIVKAELVVDRPVLLHRTFDEFYRLHRDQVARALVLTLGDRDLGSEAADEAMVRTLQHWRKVSGYECPEGWAYRVGLNWATSRLRRRRNHPGKVAVRDSVTDAVPDVDVEAALAGLAVPLRSVVVLRLYLDWSVATTAEALGVRPGTVKSRLSRAMDQLRDVLGVER